MDEQNLAAILRDMRGDVKALRMKVGYPGKFLDVPKEVKARRLQKYVTRAVELRRDGEFYDVGEESVGYVEAESETRPRLFVGESKAEAMNENEKAFEQTNEMVETAKGRWRTPLPLALRYFRFKDGEPNSVRFVEEIADVTDRVPFSGSEREVRMRSVALRTLRLCMREFLIDGVKRDRLPWGGDLSVSLIANAYSYRDPEIVKRTLTVLDSAGWKAGDVNGIIDYSLWHVISHEKFQEHFGDLDFLKASYPKVAGRLDAFAQRVGKDGLIDRASITRRRTWLFIDWTNDAKSTTAVNMLYYGALLSGAKLAERVGAKADAARWTARAAALKAKLHERAWDAKRGLFRFDVTDPAFGHFTRHANIYAAYFGVAEGAELASIGAALAADDLPAVGTPYVCAYQVMALLKCGCADAARKCLECVWGGMLDAGATSFWEGFDVKEKGDARWRFYGRPYGKSLCHAWSAAPVFLLPMLQEAAHPAGDSHGCAGMPTGRFSQEMPSSTNLKPLTPAAGEMRETFRNPFGKIRTGCYWYWLAGNISCEGARRDLEAMKRAGIDLAYIGDIKDGPAGKVRTFSPEWEQVLQASFQRASELGIELGLFNSPGWSQSGGPWVRPAQAMRRLAQGETRVTGPKAGPIALPLPDLAGRPTNEWQDVAVVAYPVPRGSAGRLVSDRSFEKGPDGQFAVEFTSARPFAAQSVRLNLNPGHLSCTVRVEAFKDGRFQPVGGETLCSRINDRLNVGFLPSAPAVGTFAPVTATRFRVVAVGFWKGGPGNVASVELLEAPGVSLAYEKSLARMYESTLPPWKHYMWPDEPPEAPGSAFDPARAVVLTDRLGADGRLAWDVPAGEWAIFRYVMTPTGTQNAPANPEATGYEVDKLSATHVAAHFDSYLGRILDRTPSAGRRAIAHTIVDSYEQGGQNATDDFAARFKASFGYDPTPYYPTCFGAAVASRDLSDRFLWDLRRFVADEVAYSYVGGLRAVSNRRGLKLWLENYGHWGFPGEFLQYGGQADGVGGEFWSGRRSIDEVRAAASCAHTYGKREVWCESHTSGGKRFDRGPMDLKSDADWHFSEGVNATILHVYVQQDTERAPGNVAWFGNEFNRHNTWFEHFDLFTGYMKRAGYLLRLGRNVADVAYFIGEDAPKMTGLREPQLPAGRQYDFINAEVLCETAGVDDAGRLVLPDGTRYEVLVLPPQATMRPQMVARLEQLVRAGAYVLGPKPVRSPSLADYPAADARVKETANRLWGEVDGKTVKSARRGKGTIAWGLSLDEALAARGSAADVIHDGRFCFAHRTLPQSEIYFVATRDGKRVERAELSFRTTGRIPEIWDAATGEIRPVESWRAEGSRTVVSLSLAERESAFVVFAKDAGGLKEGRGPSVAAVAEVAGPWTACFQSDKLHRGPKDPVRMDRLRDLSASDDPAIRYYSGKVIYRTSFAGSAAKPGERIYLDLGDVAVTAKAKVNGKAVGGVCFAPYRLDVTDFVRDGKNELEVEVCTRWVNRLAGDNGLPNRPTWTSLPVKYSKKKLIKSGLVGPVRVVRERVSSDSSGADGQSGGLGPDAKFGFVFFRNNGERGVFLATSADGLNWKEANGGKPVVPAILDDRITRDPSVCLGPDGKYHMVFTTSWKHRGFGVVHSDDLINWTKPEFVGINEDWPEAANTWAPEIIWDASAKRYVVIYATAMAKDRNHHRQYFTTTTDFKTWTPRQLYYENATSSIDSFPVQADGKWLIVCRDHEALRIVWSKGGLFGPWEPAGVRLDSAACWGEGPAALRLDDGRWVIYFDCTWNKCYGSLVTRDFKTFEPVKVTLPKGIRHGTAFRLKQPPLTAADIQIRDPFVVTDAANGRYLLLSSYFVPKSGGFGFLGTGAKVYETHDLETFKPATQVLDIPKEYGCKAFWAPEMHFFRGKWYLFGTINYERGKAPGKGERGTWSFVSDSPEGPFRPTGKRPITPVDWNALDGTFWEEDGKPYMVFCHEWTQIGNGEMCLVPLADDLSAAIGEPKTLFKATDYTPTPARDRRHRVWDKVTDGPFLYRSPTSGKLYMIWANMRRQGYAEIVCESASGKVAGPWTNFRLLFERDGGHGMLFRKLDGSLALTLHQPNSSPHERAKFFDIEEADGSLRIRPAGPPPAGNPIVGEGEFLSDPSAKVGPDGKLWVFGSRDECATRYCSRANDVLSTSDMKTWTLAKDILRGTGRTLYAPDALWHDGRWWLFFCTPDRAYAEGIASADKATGPFTGAIQVKGCNQIDPSVFRDDDGTLYYTFGQFSMKMAKLRPDMSGIDESTLKDGVIDEKNHNFHEGSQLFKRGDTYYLAYADIGRRKTPTCIGYATAKSPFGPYTYRGVIIDNYGCDPKSWNNHGGVFEFGGKWYVLYHRSTNASKMFRKACVEPIEFDENGLIREVEMTSSGVGGDLDPYAPVEARLACVMSGNVRIALTGGGDERLAEIRNGDTATWRYFDFGKPATCMTVRLVSAAGGKIVLKGGCGETYGEVEVPAGDGKTLSEVKMSLDKPFRAGRAAVVFEFSGAADAKRLFDIDEFTFAD